MKYKLLIPIFVFVVLMTSVMGYTLVDSEDFESYSVGDTTQIFGKWNCTDSGDYPTCVGTEFGGGGGAGKFEIVQYAGDKYLRMYALNGTTIGGGVTTQLQWDHIDGSGQAEANHTIKYKIWFLAYDLTGISGGDLRYVYYGDIINSQTTYLVDYVGFLPSANLTYHRQGRMMVDVSGWATGLGCVDIADGNLHEVAIYYYSNGTRIRNKSMFVDGVECTYNDSINYQDAFFPIQYIDFKVGSRVSIFLDDIEVYEGIAPAVDPTGPLGNCTHNCTTWSPPYLLKENFNGYLDFCDWATTEQICFINDLSRTSLDGYYSMFKLNDEFTDADNRYLTVSFDLLPNDMPSDSWIALSLYDSDYYRFIQFLVGENGSLYNNEGGDVTLKYNNVSTTLSKTIQLHIDFTNDDFDLYYDDIKIVESLELVDDFVNIDDLLGIRVSSASAGYDLDNIQIFASNQNNEIILADVELISAVDVNRSFCNLFLNEEPSCTSDADCQTNSCLPSGKCNRFDMSYCDENGIKRGNYCMIAGIANCGLTSLSSIILDNFLLFLVFLIIIIIISYLVYSFKER